MHPQPDTAPESSTGKFLKNPAVRGRAAGLCSQHDVLEKRLSPAEVQPGSIPIIDDIINTGGTVKGVVIAPEGC